MSKIVKQDTNGVKPLLQTGELGYDNYPSGGDAGRVYVGTGSSNVALAKKLEVTTVDGKVDTHVARVDNPHGVTKVQVGLGNVDNTSDSDKPISTATQTALDAKQATLVSGTNIKTIEGQSIVGSGNIDLSKNDVGLSNVDNTADTAKVVASAGKWTTARLINGSSVNGTSDVTTSKWGTSRSITIGGTAKSVDGSSNIIWTLGEIGAIGTDSPAFTGTPTATTAAVGTNTTQLATTAFVNAEIANDAIPRITSIDTAIPKFNGTTGNLQSSGIRINNNDGIVIPKVGGGSTTVTVADGATNTNLVLPESGTVYNSIGVKNEISNGTNLVISPTGALGYGTGAGGVVTQLTSKSTAVTLNKPTGQITMHNAALAAGASAVFTLNNSIISGVDVVIADWNNGNYRVTPYGSAAGSCTFIVQNVSAGSLSDSLAIQFSVTKGAAA